MFSRYGSDQTRHSMRLNGIDFINRYRLGDQAVFVSEQTAWSAQSKLMAVKKTGNRPSSREKYGTGMWRGMTRLDMPTSCRRQVMNAASALPQERFR